MKILPEEIHKAHEMGFDLTNKLSEVIAKELDSNHARSNPSNALTCNLAVFEAVAFHMGSANTMLENALLPQQLQLIFTQMFERGVEHAKNNRMEVPDTGIS